MSDPQAILTLLGPSKDNQISISEPTGRRPIFAVQIDPSAKPQVQLSRLLPAPQPGQQLTQLIGSSTSSSTSDDITFVIHGHEVKVNNISYGTDPFSSPFRAAQVPSGGLLWISTGRGNELWDESKTVKIAKARPHLYSGGEPELMMYVPAEDGFVDMVVLMATTLMVRNKQGLKVGGQIFNAILGMPTGSG